jgi:hypothetical protein
MDEVVKGSDRKFVRQLEAYFTRSSTGRYRTTWILGAVVAVIPAFSPCYVLGIPFGIWAILRLRKLPPETKRVYRESLFGETPK